MAEGLGSVGDPVEEELELDMSLSDVIQMMQKVETEYKGGELTEKGYKKRIASLKLKKELLEGDITKKGFRKKMKELESAELGTCDPAVDAATALRNAPKQPSIKKELGRLFGRVSQGDFVSSAVAAVGGPQKKKKKSGATVPKQITTVCLFEDSAFIPRKKARELLAKNGRIRSVKMTSKMSNIEIEDALKATFSEFAREGATISYFKADKCNGLAKAAAPQTSDELFELIGQGCLYIKLSYDEEIQKDEATPSELVQELDADLKNQVLDPMLGMLWLEEIGLCEHQEDTPDEEFSQQCLQNGEFLLYSRGLEVQRWMSGRKARGYEVKVKGSFVIVDEDAFSDFDEHRKIYRQQKPEGRAVPKCDLLLSWMVEAQVSLHAFEEHGENYFILNDKEFEKLTWWVKVKRDNLLY